MIEQIKAKNSKSFYCIRGFLIFVSFFVISKLTTLSTTLFSLPYGGETSPIYGTLPNPVVYIICSVAAIFIFNSVSLAFATFDRNEMKNFLEREETQIHLTKEIANILKTPHLIIEIAVSLVFTAITALIGGFYEIGGIFFDSTHRGGWFPTVILLPICFAISIFAKYEARRYWIKLNRENNLEKVTRPYALVLRMIIILFMYPLLFPLAPIMAAAVYSAFAILFTLFKTLTIVGIIIVLILIPIIFVLIPYLKFISRRRRFFKKMKRIANTEGYTVSNLKDAYAYFKKSGRTCSFDLALGDATYNCIVISTSRRGVPLVFESPTNAHFEHRLGTDGHNLSMKRNVDLFPRGDGKKILIVLPSPKHVFVTDGIKRKRLSQSEKLWEYTIHDDASFLGTMSRKSLDKSATYD